MICLLATVWGVINALDTPARQALVPMLVAPGLTASASGLTGTVLLVGMTAGSALGAAILATAGLSVTLQTAEPSMTSRVMATLAMVLLGGMAAGGPIASSVIALTGPRECFALGAIACAATILFRPVSPIGQQSRP